MKYNTIASALLFSALSLCSTNAAFAQISGISSPISGQPITNKSNFNAVESNSHREDFQMIALNIPNFKPGVRYRGGLAELTIPQALLASPIDQILRANEGRMKDTEFQKVDVSNMRFSLVEEPLDQCGSRPNCIPSNRSISSGIRVTGQWQFQFREKIGCAFKKCHYTRWSSVSGTFSQPLYFSVSNSILNLQAGGLTIRGERFLVDATNWVAGLFDVHGSVRQGLSKQIQDFNGMNLRQLLIRYGRGTVPDDYIERINQGNLNARVSRGSLIVSVSFPVGSLTEKQHLAHALNNADVR